MQSQIARETSYLKKNRKRIKKQMGLIFSPVYQPRQYGCIHVIHTFTKIKTLQEKVRTKK